MNFAMLGLRLLGWARSLLDIAKRGLRWILSDWRHIVIAVLAVIAVVTLVQRNDARDGEAKAIATAKSNLAWGKRWQSAYGRLLADTEEERRVAAELDRANAQRVTAELQRVKERTAHDYETRLVDTRAALGSLQSRLARASTGDSGGGNPTGGDTFGARCQAFGAADCDTLFATLPTTLAAAERNTAALIGLQEYICNLLATDWGNAEPDSFAPDVVAACAGHGITLRAQ